MSRLDRVSACRCFGATDPNHWSLVEGRNQQRLGAPSRAFHRCCERLLYPAHCPWDWKTVGEGGFQVWRSTKEVPNSYRDHADTDSHHPATKANSHIFFRLGTYQTPGPGAVAAEEEARTGTGIPLQTISTSESERHHRRAVSKGVEEPDGM